jgi:hypothetical protein
MNELVIYAGMYCMYVSIIFQDVYTRWNSTYIMLSRLVIPRVKAAASQAWYAYSGFKETLLTDQEWEIAEALERVLEPCFAATTVFEGSQYSTLSMFWPITYNLIHKYRNPSVWAGISKDSMAEYVSLTAAFIFTCMFVCA